MVVSVTSTQQWRISTRTRGEVLAATAGSEDCQFLVLRSSGEQSLSELESWLGDLLGVAADGMRTDQNPRPIPRLLHHALTGLLFSHREVWNSGPPGSTLSLAFVRAGEEVAFGWVGECAPMVWIDDRPADVEWVRVRDHGGREAFALGAKAGSRVRVSLDWLPAGAASGTSGVEVEAVWGAAAEPRPRMAEEEPEAAPFTMAEVLVPWAEAPPTPSASATGPPGTYAEAPGPAPPWQPDAGAAGRGESHAPVAASLPPEAALPELIPPSPEPLDLTARALRSQTASVSGPTGSVPRGAPALTAAEIEGVPVPSAGEAPSAPPARPRPRPRMRPAWPSERELERSRRRGRRTWMWVAAALAVALVAVAWAAGIIPGVGRPNGKAPWFALLGLGAARFDVSVESRPPGAWIAADGKDLQQRTPATIELAAGEHQIALSFPDLGSASFQVRGARGDRQALSAPLWGSLSVGEADASVPVTVELDGEAVGTAPLSVDSLAPGAHELRFTGPGLTPWGQALRVRVGENTEVVARPMTSPASGVLEVRATFTDGNGTNALTGAGVWVDGERRGVTPLVLELPRGPHSARVEYRGERTPVEVIDLPGGNQRFASFELGVNPDAPTLEAGPLPGAVPLGRPTVVSADLNGVSATDVREMWLNVREPEGTWRRYQMVMLKAPGGVVGVAVFPVALFDSHGIARYYVSATDQTGDDYFTEILSAHSAPKLSAAR